MSEVWCSDHTRNPLELRELFAILADPAPKHAPAPDQRLVGDLEGLRLRVLVLAADHQARVDQAGQSRLKHGAPSLVPGRLDLGELDAAARIDGLVVAGVDQPHEDLPRLPLLLRGQPSYELIGVPLQRADEAAHRLVGVGRQSVTVALRPQAPEGVLQERQGARLRADVGEDPVEQARREAEADPLGGALQDVAHLFGIHARHGDPVGLVVGDAVEAEAGVVEHEVAAAAEEVDA
ncbi:MAG: hypothetical protein IPK80_14835 [Nannocystis sp.]|nr:hypothetical protein [Nannocystis sp.]